MLQYFRRGSVTAEYEIDLNEIPNGSTEESFVRQIAQEIFDGLKNSDTLTVDEDSITFLGM